MINFKDFLFESKEKDKVIEYINNEILPINDKKVIFSDNFKKSMKLFFDAIKNFKVKVKDVKVSFVELLNKLIFKLFKDNNELFVLDYDISEKEWKAISIMELIPEVRIATYKNKNYLIIPTKNVVYVLNMWFKAYPSGLRLEFKDAQTYNKLFEIIFPKKIWTKIKKELEKYK